MKNTTVMHRSMLTDFPQAVSGDGVYVYDSGGKAYLDACGGAAVTCLGYNNQRVSQALTAQISKLSYIHSSFFTTDAMEQLADELIKYAPGSNHFSHMYFVSGGSEAVEAALKLARQYYVDIEEPTRHLVIARRQSYHGNTVGALSVSGNFWRREPFDPILLKGNHISPCNAYRDLREGEFLEAYGLRVANELEHKIQELGAENVMAFIAETVGGATAGVLPAVPGYFKRIREICDDHGVLLILDEVMCGMGRTGTLHACDQEEVVADIQTVAKGIAGGYQPLGAVYVSNKIASAVAGERGYFHHGHTYMGHVLACAAGLATQQEIRERGLLDNVKKQGQLLKSMLHQALDDNPYVGNIRGRGLFVGIELVMDQHTKKPFDPALGLHKKIKRGAQQKGLMCYPMGGTVDGHYGDHILLAPAFIIESSHIEQIVTTLKSVIETETRN